jgi:hypothetical protein
MYHLFMYQLNLKKTTKALMFTMYAQGGSCMFDFFLWLQVLMYVPFHWGVHIPTFTF